MLTKQLIIAVEGTAALGSFWHTIFTDYLDKIIRYFCSAEHSGQKLSSTHVELSLVMFNGHGSYSGFLVQRSGWTKDMDTYLQWLSALPFAGGGFNDAAIAEGLSEVLMMFALPNESQGQNSEVQRHCILIAASNPYPLPTPVYRPQMQKLEKSENAESQSDSRLCDAETLAKSFPQCGVSLSVICPKQLPKLRGIYNAGKHNPRAADPPLENGKNPSFLVLISENFMEALRSGKENSSSNQNPVKTDAITAPPVSLTAPASATPPANGSIVVRPPISAVHNAPATVKVEPTTITSMAVPTFPYTPPPRATSQAAPASQNPPPLPTSQEVISNNDNAPEMKPLVSTSAPTLRPGGAAVNVRILNGVAQARLGGNTSIGGAPMLSNMISTGLSSIPPDQTGVSSASSGAAQISGSLPVSAAGPVANSAPAPFIPSGSNPIMPQPLSNQQGNGSLSQTIPSMSQGNLPATQMVQNGTSINQNVMNGSGVSGIVSGNGTMMPTPGMSQQGQPGMQTMGLNNGNSVTNMPLNQQTSSTMQSAQSKYVKLWEGNLSGQRQGKPVFITRLEGFRNVTASETLAANWPSTMQIVRLISQDHMNNKQYVGKADFLVFRAMNQHGFLGQLQEKKLCAVIQLPSQTLLLSVSDKAHRLIGMLFPGDMVVFKPQISSQHQQQLQAHLQQQQQQQQLLPQMQQQQTPQQQQPLIPIQQQQMPQLQQQQQSISQLHQQPISQIQQSQPQQQPQQQQQMGMNQGYMQGGGWSGMPQGQVSSQGQGNIGGGAGGFMS